MIFVVDIDFNSWVFYKILGVVNVIIMDFFEIDSEIGIKNYKFVWN